MSDIALLQVWQDNMNTADEPTIEVAEGEQEYTCVTFHPDLQRFKMKNLDKDIISLFRRRAYDVALTVPDVKVSFNERKVPVCDWFKLLAL